MELNRWGEPTGLNIPERGDYVQVVAGTTTGYVIGVRTRLWQVVDVHFVMDGPCPRPSPDNPTPEMPPRHVSQVQCFLETRDPRELTIVKKGVR